MTFAAAAALKTVSPITLLEIDTQDTQSLFAYYEPGIAYIDLKSSGVAPYDFWGSDDYNTSTVSVSTLTVTPTSGGSEETYTEVSSLANLRTQNKGWYFNATAQELYIHFDNYDPWWTFDTIEIGYSSGYSDCGYHSGTTYYPPAIAGSIKISERTDNEFYGLQRYTPIDVDLYNDGSLDNLPKQDLYGKVAKILLGFEDLDNGYDDFEVIKTGYIENIPTIAMDKVTITINDARKFLSKSLPENRVTQSTYANLSDDDQNRVIPLAFGSVRGCEPICLNTDEAAPASYTMLIADTDKWDLNSTTPVCYVNGTSVTVSAWDETAGTFTLATADYDPEEDDVYCDLTGYDDGGVIQSGPDIIKELLVEFADIAYISDNFDTTQWATASAAAYDIGLFVDDAKSIGDICAEVAQSCRGLFKQTRAGKWTFLFENDSAAAVDTVYQRDILNRSEAKYDADKYISSGTCKYSAHWFSDKFRRVSDDSYEADAYATYKQYKSKEFETIIGNSTDAADYLDAQLSKNSTIYPVFEITTSLQFIAVNLLDNVNVEINRLYDDWYGTIKCQVIGIGIQPSKGLIDFDLRYIEDA